MAPKPPGNSKSSSKTPKARKSATAGPSKGSKFKVKRPPPVQQKTKPGVHNNTEGKKKRRTYTDKELKLPALNMITPAGVQKPRGKKKGKIFVDDKESMMTILAMVNAEKEGQIESKMIKARQMEEIREARRQEAEVREEKRRDKLEDVKKGLKRKKGPKSSNSEGGGRDLPNGMASKKVPKKRVSFAS